MPLSRSAEPASLIIGTPTVAAVAAATLVLTNSLREKSLLIAFLYHDEATALAIAGVHLEIRAG
jgi:hypothetical protein